jgi:hypothetical protein
VEGRVRRTLTVKAEIPELGLRQTFVLSVGPNGDIKAEQLGCFVFGHPENPMVGVELQTDADKLRRLCREEIHPFVQATRDDLADD